MKFKLLFAVIIVFTVAVSAQKMKVESGDFSFLRGQTSINVVFDYSETKMNKENISVDEYVTNRVKDLNGKNKGTGDTWKKRWDSSAELIWNPKFLELMNKYLGKTKGVYFEENAQNSTYTLLVKVDWMYPGWDAGVMKQHAKVTTTLQFVETANQSKVLVEVSSKEAPGDQWGNNYNNETRIGEGFAKTAKSLAKLIEKKI